MSGTGDVAVAVYTAGGAQRWVAPASSLPFDDTIGSPWLLVPPAVRVAFDSMTGCGAPLAETAFGSPMLGVKCGCNAAFVVGRDSSAADAEPDELLATIRTTLSPTNRDASRSGRVERALLRPVVRGQTLGRWLRSSPIWDAQPPGADRFAPKKRGTEWIIWTHEDPESGTGGPRPTLPPHAARWLGHWRHRLAARSDTRGQTPWWALFRTDSASVARPRVVWADLGRAPRAVVLPPGDPTVPLNSCYVARAPDLVDAYALSALLNSAPAAAWLNILAEPARGGYRRYMGWTVALLPLPHAWAVARALLAPIAIAAAEGTAPSEARLTAAVAAAYRLDVEALGPLLGWSGA